MVETTCIGGTLTPKTSPLNTKEVQHLYNRIGSGASPSDYTYATGKLPATVVQKLLNDATLQGALPIQSGSPWSWAEQSKYEMELSLTDLANGISNNGFPVDPPGTPDNKNRWKYYDGSSYQLNYDYYRLYMSWRISGDIFKGLIESNPVKYKLLMFWHNHFVISFSDIPSGYMLPNTIFSYYDMLHRNTFGNFKTFVKDIGLSQAMLLYLNGNLNYVYNGTNYINENYAREVLELFTMGPKDENGNANYTQNDIHELARALTGTYTHAYLLDWNKYTTYKDMPKFYPYHHDLGEKTIFGQKVKMTWPTLTSNYYYTVNPDNKTESYFDKIKFNQFINTFFLEYDKVHDVIFEQRASAIAKFVCRKLYKYYVYAGEVPQNIINGLASTFVSNGFNIMPVIRQLLMSEHFYQAAAMQAQVKSPVEMVTQFFHTADFKGHLIADVVKQDYNFDDLSYGYGNIAENSTNNFRNQTTALNQYVLNPPNVAGWPGYRTWINEGLYTKRGGYWKNDLIPKLKSNSLEKLRTWIKTATNNSQDPAVIVKTFADRFLGIDILDSGQLMCGVSAFKAGVPENYYMNGTWTLDYYFVPNQIANLLKYLFVQPEFHLN